MFVCFSSFSPSSSPVVLSEESYEDYEEEEFLQQDIRGCRDTEWHSSMSDICTVISIYSSSLLFCLVSVVCSSVVSKWNGRKYAGGFWEEIITQGFLQWYTKIAHTRMLFFVARWLISSSSVSPCAVQQISPTIVWRRRTTTTHNNDNPWLWHPQHWNGVHCILVFVSYIFSCLCCSIFLCCCLCLRSVLDWSNSSIVHVSDHIVCCVHS